MKKFYLLIVMIFSLVNMQAQYKKASFLTKSGRTYDLGVSGHFISEGNSTVPGIYYSYGKDNGKRFFHWFDLELLLPTKFEYQTVDRDYQVPVTVTGKSKIGLVYRYNFAGYLTNIKNKDAKFKPFATLGLNFLILGGTAKPAETKYTPDTYYPETVLPTNGFSYGANAGVGIIYNFTDKIGAKLAGGYNYQGQLNTESFDDTYKSFDVYTSHPYVNLGVRFTLHDD